MPDMQITFIQKLKIKTLFLGQEICPLFSLGCTLTPSTMFLWSFHFSLILSNLIVMCLSFLGVCVYLCCLEFTEILRYVDLEYSLNLKLFLLLFFPKVSVSLFHTIPQFFLGKTFLSFCWLKKKKKKQGPISAISNGSNRG